MTVPSPNPGLTELDELCIATMRFLSIDGVEKAKAGHPGMPMGMAPAAYVLWDRHLRHNPANPQWHNRDRFVLSAGHGIAGTIGNGDPGHRAVVAARPWGYADGGKVRREGEVGVRPFKPACSQDVFGANHDRPWSSLVDNGRDDKTPGAKTPEVHRQVTSCPSCCRRPYCDRCRHTPDWGHAQQ